MGKTCTRCGGAVLAVILLLGGACVLLSPDLRDTASAQDTAKPAAKWEHCELMFWSGNCSYRTAKENFNCKSSIDLAKKLKVPAKDWEKVTSEDLLVIDFLAGQGWELVSHVVLHMNTNLNSEKLLFKRRVGK
jgi:hypothetical protein